jgi:hypothetical protein
MTSPANPPPDRNLMMNMFATFAEAIDKKCEDIFEKKMAKVEKKDKKEAENVDENKGETADLIVDDIQNF